MKDLLFACVCVAGIVVMFGVGEHIDDSEPLPRPAAATEPVPSSAFERGRLAGRQEMTQSVSAAYSQGQRDAMQAVQGTPRGLALAQACLAQQRASGGTP